MKIKIVKLNMLCQIITCRKVTLGSCKRKIDNTVKIRKINYRTILNVIVECERSEFKRYIVITVFDYSINCSNTAVIL